MTLGKPKYEISLSPQTACEQSEGPPGEQDKAWPLGTPAILLRLKSTPTGKLIAICMCSEEDLGFGLVL